MRTKPPGTTCWMKRRRNSIEVSVLVRRCPPGIDFPPAAAALAVERDQPMIADRHTMRVPPTIPQDRGGPTKGGFGIDDPVGVEERVDEGVPLGRVAQGRGGAGEVERVTVVRA